MYSRSPPRAPGSSCPRNGQAGPTHLALFQSRGGNHHGQGPPCSARAEPRRRGSQEVSRRARRVGERDIVVYPPDATLEDEAASEAGRRSGGAGRRGHLPIGFELGPVPWTQCTSVVPRGNSRARTLPAERTGSGTSRRPSGARPRRSMEGTFPLDRPASRACDLVGRDPPPCRRAAGASPRRRWIEFPLPRAVS